jgi:hypothetical protein
MKLMALLALAPAALLLSAAGRYEVRPTTIRVMAQPEHSPSEARDYRAGDLVFSAPLGWAMAGKLRSDLKVAGAGGELVVPAGTILPAALVTARHPGKIRAGNIILCLEKSSPLSDRLAQMLLARANLAPVRGAQACLLDSNYDGMLDSAAAIGFKGDLALDPMPVAPTAYDQGSDFPIGGRSEASIQFNGTQFGTSNPYFDLRVVVDGKARRFTDFEYSGTGGKRLAGFEKVFHVARKTGFPQSKEMLGGQMTVLSYEGGTLRLRWDEPVKPGNLQLVFNAGPLYIYY